MRKVKELIVDALDEACFVVDRLPNWTYPFVGRFIGCPRGMAMWAWKLMDRWGIEGKTVDNDRDVW